eukprot:9281354-Pyramimonas_sp.AAC.1
MVHLLAGVESERVGLCPLTGWARRARASEGMLEASSVSDHCRFDDIASGATFGNSDLARSAVSGQRSPGQRSARSGSGGRGGAPDNVVDITI